MYFDYLPWYIYFTEEKKVRRYLDDNFHDRPELIKPNEQIYDIKREYESEDESRQKHRMVDLGKKQYKGSGPRTKDGELYLV